MRVLYGAALVTAVLIMAPKAFAQDGGIALDDHLYGTVYAGPSWQKIHAGGIGDIDTDTGYDLGAAVGWKWAPNVRTELDMTWQHSDIDETAVSGDVSSLSLMGNGILDIQSGGPISPYVGAGIGGARVGADFTSPGINVDDSDWAFAYQLMAGATYHPTEATSLSLGYRWFDASDASLDGVDVGFASHQLNAGLKISF